MFPQYSARHLSPKTKSDNPRRRMAMTTMSSSRKRRTVSERRLAKVSKRSPITIWTIIIIVLVALAVGIARIMK
jgi:hypothetical protein